VPKPSHLQSVNPNSAPAAPGASSNTGGVTVESVAKPGKRRFFSAADKLRIVRAAAACTKRGDLEALLRREAIYSSQLTRWRDQLALHGREALGVHKRGPKPKHDAKDLRIAELEKRTRKLEAKLLLAGKVIALQKKASEILGIDLGSEDES
jgi:transposase